MKIYPLFFLLIAVLLISCNKDDTGVTFSLPAKTQSGQNTFGFLLNSSVWRNYGQVCFVTIGCNENLAGTYYRRDGSITVRADKVLYKNGSWNTIENFDFDLSTNFNGTGTYNTSNGDKINVGYRLAEQGKQDKSYLLSENNPIFMVKVTTIDTTRKILSGEFSGTLFRRLSDTSFVRSLTDSISITEGRFDIKIE